MSDRPVVLFLCTGNSARSQMAEAILRHYAADRYQALSAGLEPKGVHPLAVRVLEELGIETGGLRSKSVQEYLGRVHARHAIILCASAQSQCPSLYPFANQVHYWPFPDPAATEGDEAERLRQFRIVRDQIAERVATWLAREAEQPESRTAGRAE